MTTFPSSAGNLSILAIVGIFPVTQSMSIYELASNSTPADIQFNRKTAAHVIVGALLGLIWGSVMRAWVILRALQIGDTPNVTWLGTAGGCPFSAAVHDRHNHSVLP